jgi:hypothetical protein
MTTLGIFYFMCAFGRTFQDCGAIISSAGKARVFQVRRTFQEKGSDEKGIFIFA